MSKTVVKKDGTREDFNPDKIKNSVEKAAADAGLTEGRRQELGAEVLERLEKAEQARQEVATSELREKILKILDELAPSVSEAWRKYDRERNRI